MSIRQQFESALVEWNESVDRLNDAIADFVNDGVVTGSGTWILTMSQMKGRSLQAARHRADAAKIALDHFIDDLQMPQGARQSN